MGAVAGKPGGYSPWPVPLKAISGKGWISKR